MVIQNNILLIRTLTKLSQPKFGDLIGATKDQVHTWESGKAQPNPIYLTRIAEIAGVTTDLLEKKKLKDSEIVLNYTTTISSPSLATGGKSNLPNFHESARILDLKEQIEELKKDKQRLYELLVKGQQTR